MSVMTKRGKRVTATKSVRELRESLADVLNDAAVRGTVTYITSRGRRIAAVVPVPVADEAVEPPHDPAP